MGNLSLTVVIPTYNRKNILERCLDALFNQAYPYSDYEIIVIDDGSPDSTKDLVMEVIKKTSCQLRYFKQENKGPAAARNVGIKNANGKILLFIGDDIIATPTLLEEHSNWHKLYPDDNVGVLGYVTWHPEIEITPFMKWLENGGPQFHFWQIKDKVDVDTQRYFYTSNLSVKRKFLMENYGFFDEEFPYAAYEDIELGCRLKKRGMILKYNKEAVGYHYHYTSIDDACRRMIKVGESHEIMMEKLDSVNFFTANRSLLRGILNRGGLIVHYFIARICYPIAKFYEKRTIKKNIFGYIMRYYQFIGINCYRNKRK